MATAYFGGLEGDVRVVDGDRILVTYYNAPDADILRAHYENMPAEALRAEETSTRACHGFADFKSTTAFVSVK